MSKNKIMPSGLPYLAAGLVWFLAALVLPVYKLVPLIICALLAIAVFIVLQSMRKSQLAKLPKAPAPKVRVEDLAKKLDTCCESLKKQENRIDDADVKRTVHSIATTLELIADEVEKDPKDRNKVRKLANHYCDMIRGLVDKYVLLGDPSRAVTDGAGGTVGDDGSGAGNIEGTKARIKEGLANTDRALKKILDSMFSDDAMEVSADISTLEQLLNMEDSNAKMDFQELRL